MKQAGRTYRLPGLTPCPDQMVKCGMNEHCLPKHRQEAANFYIWLLLPSNELDEAPLTVVGRLRSSPAADKQPYRASHLVENAFCRVDNIGGSQIDTTKSRPNFFLPSQSSVLLHASDR